MSGRHRPTNGADSYDITDMSADGAQETGCVMCGGRGTMTTDSGPVSCPSCHAQELCGSCGYMTPKAELDVMDNGRYRWFRCHSCRDRDNARWAAEEAAEARWKEMVAS